MQIENIAELAEDIYWRVLSEFGVDQIGDGYLKLDDDGLGFSENTECGQELYFAIEEIIKGFIESKYIKSNYPECKMCGIDNYVCLECEQFQREELCQQ